jgi:cytochrome P450
MSQEAEKTAICEPFASSRTVQSYERQKTVTQTNNRPLGEAYQPFGEQLEDPYPFYARARQQEPVFYSELLQAYIVTGYDDIVSILNQPELFSSRDTLRPLVTFSPRVFAELSKGYPFVPIHVNNDGKEHLRFRTPLSKALAPARIRAWEPLIRERANALVDTFINDRYAEMITQFAYPLPLEVILTLFGIPKEDMADTKRWSDDLLAFTSSQLSEELQVKCARSVVAFQHYLAQLVKERRNDPKDDVISAMVATQPGERPFDDAELVNVLSGTLLAGHETTTNLIGNGLLLLLEHPEHWQRLCDHPERIPLALEEILRYDSSVQTFFRTTTRQVTVGGVVIPAETLLLLVFGSANRDETQFPDAQTFDIQRSPNRHLAFGHGVHFCVGVALARLEGRIAFETLTKRLPSLRLVPHQRLSHVPTLMFRGYQRLEVEW